MNMDDITNAALKYEAKADIRGRNATFAALDFVSGGGFVFTELQAEIDLLTAKLAMVEKSLGHWHNEAMTLTDENRKLLYLLEKQKTETAEAYAEARRYHKAYHQLLEQLKNEKK